jgi:hypothetical protein
MSLAGGTSAAESGLTLCHAAQLLLEFNMALGGTGTAEMTGGGGDEPPGALHFMLWYQMTQVFHDSQVVGKDSPDANSPTPPSLGI